MNRFMVIRTTLAIGALVLSTGCASIMGQNYAGYPVTTTPPGATVIVNGYSYQSTPLVLAASRNNPHMIRIEREGCPTFDAVVTSRMTGWVWGNLIFGGVIGLMIDMASEAAYELHPDHLAVRYGEQNGKCVIAGSNLASMYPPVPPPPLQVTGATYGYVSPRGQ